MDMRTRVHAHTRVAHTMHSAQSTQHTTHARTHRCTCTHARTHAHHARHAMHCTAPQHTAPYRNAPQRNARTWSSCRCWNRTAVATYFPSFLGGAGCAYRLLCQSLAVLAFHENLAPTRCVAIASGVASAARVTSIRQRRAPSLVCREHLHSYYGIKSSGPGERACRAQEFLSKLSPRIPVCQIRQTRMERGKTAGASRNTSKGQGKVLLYRNLLAARQPRPSPSP